MSAGKVSSHPGDVHLADHVLPWLDVLAGLGEEDASALAARVRLADVGLVLFGSGVGLKVTVTAEGVCVCVCQGLYITQYHKTISCSLL